MLLLQGNRIRTFRFCFALFSKAVTMSYGSMMRNAIILGSILWFISANAIPTPLNSMLVGDHIEPTCFDTVSSHSSPGWNATTLNVFDCAHAADFFERQFQSFDSNQPHLFTSIKNNGNVPSNISSLRARNTNAFSPSLRPNPTTGLISLPLRWTYKSCSIVMQMGHVYDNEPWRRNILRKAPRGLDKIDCATFLDVKFDGVQNLHECYIVQQVPGWTILGKQNSIEIYVWEAASPIGEFTGPAVPLPPSVTNTSDLIRGMTA